MKIMEYRMLHKENQKFLKRARKNEFTGKSSDYMDQKSMMDSPTSKTMRKSDYFLNRISQSFKGINIRSLRNS